MYLFDGKKEALLDFITIGSKFSKLFEKDFFKDPERSARICFNYLMEASQDPQIKKIGDKVGKSIEKFFDFNENKIDKLTPSEKQEYERSMDELLKLLDEYMNAEVDLVHKLTGRRLLPESCRSMDQACSYVEQKITDSKILEGNWREHLGDIKKVIVEVCKVASDITKNAPRLIQFSETFLKQINQANETYMANIGKSNVPFVRILNELIKCVNMLTKIAMQMTQHPDMVVIMKCAKVLVKLSLGILYF